MQWVPADLNVDFLGRRKIGLAVSATVLIVCLLSIFVFRGIELGIDFTGGVELQVEFDQDMQIAELRETLGTLGYDMVVQNFGDEPRREYLVRIGLMEGVDNQEVALSTRKLLLDSFADQGVNIARVDVVGPTVGGELRNKGLMAMLFALVGILLYVAFRFELRYSYGAIAALLHDVLVVVGLFSLTAREFSLPTIAALLTIIGYSLNDTIVVYDRIRENRNRRRRAPLADVINRSVNETLSRTLLTSVTTLLTVLALLFLTEPGSVIHDFAFALFAGVLVGTYSSVFVASPMLLLRERAQAR